MFIYFFLKNVSTKKTRNFYCLPWFFENRWSQLQNLFFLKGMTLGFQKLFLEKNWDQNWGPQLRICTGRSGGDSTYVSKKKTPNFDFESKFDREAVVPALKSFFPLKGITLCFQKLFLKYFLAKTKALSSGFVVMWGQVVSILYSTLLQDSLFGQVKLRAQPWSKSFSGDLETFW